MADTENRKIYGMFHAPGVQRLVRASDDETIGKMVITESGMWDVKLAGYGDAPVRVATRDDALALAETFALGMQ